MTQQFGGVVVVILCVAKFIDNLPRPANEFLYRIRSSYVERWQEQIALVAIIAATSCAVIWLSRSDRMPD